MPRNHARSRAHTVRAHLTPWRSGSRLRQDGVDEVWVRQSPAGRQTPLRVVYHELLQEVDAHLPDLRLRVADVLPPFGFPHRKRWLEIWQVQHAWPLLGRGSSELLEDLEDRVDLGVAAEEWTACRHLGEDAAYAPHVDGHAVELRAEQDLQGTVPHSHDLVRVLGDRQSVSSGQSEIGDLQAQPRVDEEVLWLQVAVQDAIGVAELD